MSTPRRMQAWFGQRLPRVTSRGAVLALASVLALLLGSGIAIVGLIGRTNDLAHQAHALALDSKAKERQIQALVHQLQDVVHHNQADRLADQRRVDREIRDLICVAISIDGRARAKLLPLLPGFYAREQCRVSQTAHVTPRPQIGVPPAPPGTPVSVPLADPRSPAGRHAATGTPPPDRPSGHSPQPSRRPSGTATSQPPILDTPRLMCDLERSLGLRCTP